MNNMEYNISRFPSEREIVIDAGYLASGRHIIYALMEVDVTDARRIIQDLSQKQGGKISFTAFIVSSLARAIEKIPQVRGFRDWRGRLFSFRDADVVTMIEPKPGAVAIPHIIRQANNKSVKEISNEIRAVQAHPDSSGQSGRLVKMAPRLPRFVRLSFFKILKLNPPWFKSLAGTFVVTSVGMFGKGGGWGIGFLPTHNLGVTVGGINKKPGVHNDEIAIREYLNLTLSFDHDIIDGAPAARFANKFSELLEEATVLEELSAD
jgi:pyruvate/2-oxoglutarate dehydrogenase complex dihydrolipoamide acyltransferase (E2) component